MGGGGGGIHGGRHDGGRMGRQGDASTTTKRPCDSGNVTGKRRRGRVSRRGWVCGWRVSQGDASHGWSVVSENRQL